ncbi:UPF0481 protein At3g47200-like [Typha angustifolia]|uniref:UPF0481 protein At3g47200-like n=1 Tax=Typha angustifolia TaxID=59011 RepID=UPI003C2DA91D
MGSSLPSSTKAGIQAAETEKAKDTAIIDVKALSTAITGRFGALPETGIHAIPRIPAYILKKNKNLYVPRSIAIGPYHHGKKHLQAMEQHKFRYLQDLLKRSNANAFSANACLEGLLKKMEAMEAKARRCYSEDIKLKKTEFVQMMVLDACFIIEFLFKLDDRKGNISDVGFGGLQSIDTDLLLLENQIPFFIIEELFELLGAESNKRTFLTSHLYNHLTSENFFGAENREKQPKNPQEIHHLLHLYYHWFIGNTKERRESEKTSDKNEQIREDVIPCATVLHEAGVSFRKKILPGHNFDITFKKGVMEIPAIRIEDPNMHCFANLVAFEQSIRCETMKMTSFTLLMDSLLNTEKDVAILQRCDVIDNTLGSEKVVARLFNQLGVYGPIKKNHFAEIFRQVNRYRNNKCNKYRARLVHDYFNTPWAILSLVAALVLLALTLWQSFFATYSYFHPP